MAIEIGAAYLSILPSTDKLTAGIKSALTGSERDAVGAGKTMGTSLAKGIKSGAADSSKAIKGALKEGTATATAEGAAAGNSFGSRFTSGLSGIKSKIRSTLHSSKSDAETAGKEAGKSFGDKAGGQAVEGLGGKLKGGLIGVGITAAAALTGAFSGAMAQTVSSNKLAAQLALTPEQSKTAGKVAGALYKNGFGDSVGGLNDTLKEVMSNIPGLSKDNEKALTDVATKASTVADVFGQDISGATRAAGQLMKTGLAKNASEAFDIITTGFQNGTDKSGDFLDTINEYSTQFRKLGIDGKQMTDIISQGLKGGARDGDLVADTFKEFSIRAVDGSKTTAAGFKAIGLDGAKMSETIAKGGPGAAKATALVLDKLRAIKDPAKQAQAAVQLFGTQAEDMGKALYKIDLNKPTIGMDKFRDSTDKAGKVAYGAATNQLQGMWRTLKQDGVEAFKNVLPKIVDFGNYIKDKLAPKLKELTTSFKTGVLPVLKDVGTVLITKVLPAAKLALLPLLNSLKDIFNFIIGHKTAVIDFGVAFAALWVIMKAHAFSKFLADGGGIVKMLLGWAKNLKVVEIATKAYAAAQWLLDAAMDANPLVLLGIAIAALIVGIVLLWKNSETFRNVVLGVWGAIKIAIGVAWGVIKTVFSAIVGYITGTLVPIFKVIGTVIRGVFTVVNAIIGFAWRGIIRPIFQAIWFQIKAVLMPVFTLLSVVIRKAFSVIGAVVSSYWNGVIKPVLNAVIGFVRGPLHTAFTWLSSRISAIWNAISGAIGSVWRSGIRPVLSTIANFLTDTVSKGWDAGVKAIGSVWNGLKKIAAEPVNFVISTVWENGLRKLLTSLPGVDQNSIPHGTPIAFADGGPVTGGTRGKDSVRAWLMPGEHVLTADEVKAAGGQGAIFALRKSLKNGGMGKTFDPDPAFATGGALSAAQIAKAKAFANSQVGDPYVWGGVGPNGFDCSGFMSAITNVIEGKNPYSRVGATGSFPWGGFVKGPGQFTIGSTNNYGGSGIGHMAGTIDGMNVESRGGQGVVTGPKARGYNDSGFNTVAHLGDTSGAAPGSASGGGSNILSAVVNVIKSLKGWVSELTKMGGFGGLISQVASKVVHDVADFAKSKATLGIFDNGGILQPGAIAYNASTKPEAVFNHSQFKQFANDKKASVAPTRMELVLDNGERLSGYVRTIAGQEIDDAADYAASGNRRNK